MKFNFKFSYFTILLLILWFHFVVTVGWNIIFATIVFGLIWKYERQIKNIILDLLLKDKDNEL